MKAGSFFKFVEIQTKAASMIPFIAGAVFSVYRYQKFSPGLFLLMILSLLCFDMATTAINNYTDFKKAVKKTGYGYESHNAMVRDKIKESTAVIVIIILLVIAVVSGFLLFIKTNVVVLFIGVFSFFVGVTYSAGPVPISRTPAGEVFSGIFMGFLIPFLSAYIHVFEDQIVSLVLEGSRITLQVELVEVLSLFLFTLPAMSGIANIMLANNICDREEDLQNNRYTLPNYIGNGKSLVLFRLLYYVAYGAILMAMLLRIVPITVLLFFATLYPVMRNIKLFMKVQTKKDTFVLAVKNFTWMNVSLVAAMLLGILFSL